MFMARREFGKIVRVYEIRGAADRSRPSAWSFSGGRVIEGHQLAICGPGHCAIAQTRETALNRLAANEDGAVEDIYGG